MIALWLFAGSLPQTESIALYYCPVCRRFLSALLAYALYSSLLLNLRLRIIWCAVASKASVPAFSVLLSGRSAKCMAGCVGGSGHYADSDGHDHGIDG